MSRSDRTTPADGGTVTGTLRIEPSIKALTRRLRPGDVAVIDVLDLDQSAAEAIAARRPAVVVNVQQSISGRYPTGGPTVLRAHGITLIDNVGAAVLGARDGATATVDGGEVSVDGDVIATGTVFTEESIAQAMAGAAEGMRVQLATFTANAMDHVERESAAILDGVGLPDPGVPMEGRHVVIVAPGYQHRAQLRQIRRYLRDHRPLIVGVGEGADAALELASAPQVVMGDVESVGDEALKAADHVIVHEPHGGATGQARVDALGVDHSQADSSMPTVALAILMARAHGATVIVTVGVEGTLTDYLESSRTDASGIFLARLQAGATLVDAPALAQVYRHRYSVWMLIALMVSALAALGVAIWVTPGGRAWLTDLWETATTWIGGLG